MSNKLLNDEELLAEIDVLTDNLLAYGVGAKDSYDTRIFDLINTQKRLYAESLRSKDPHKCEFGHEVYLHKTVDGWCCACEADQAFMESEIEKRARIK